MKTKTDAFVKNLLKLLQLNWQVKIVWDTMETSVGCRIVSSILPEENVHIVLHCNDTLLNDEAGLIKITQGIVNQFAEIASNVLPPPEIKKRLVSLLLCVLTG